MLRITTPALLSFLLASSAHAQTWTSFDASRGTLPEDQCWTHVEDISPPSSYAFGLSGGDLHLSTLNFAATGSTGGGVWWQRSDVSINFQNEFAVEASLRIASAPNHSINIQTGWPRPGYSIAVYDTLGRIFWIGFGSGEIFLSNTAFGQYGSANTVTTLFNTTDAHHLYRLERAASGIGASLRIDGVIRLTLPAIGSSESSAGLIYFGDATYWANSESFTTFVRYSDLRAGECLADFNHDRAIDFFDYLDFVDAFAANLCTADFNGDGVIDFFDYLDFVDAFSLGC